MKIIHVGFPSPDFGRAFSERHEYKFMDWSSLGPFPRNDDHIVRIMEKAMPDADVIFLQVQTKGVITPEIITHPYFDGKTVINWTWDHHKGLPEWMVDIGEHAISAFTNMRDVGLMRERGHRACFLQGGFDTGAFNRTTAPLVEAEDIVFIANRYPKEQYEFDLTDYRLEMVTRLRAKYGSRFGLYGFGWPDHNPMKNFMHRPHKEAACYRGCKIAINLSHFETLRYTSDRMFRILGSGAFCLSHNYPGIEMDFVDGLHLRTWNDLDELENLIDVMLEDEEGRSAMSEEGYLHVHENYTWKNTVERIEEIANGDVALR